MPLCANRLNLIIGSPQLPLENFVSDDSWLWETGYTLLWETGYTMTTE